MFISEEEVREKIPNEDVVILYHADCCDGFGAAYSAWKRYGEAAIYIPVKHGSIPPATVVGNNVIIIDFAYKKEVLESMAEVCKSVIVIDHHKSAREDLEGFPTAFFDMNRSGAGLAWDILHNTTRPKIIDVIEDRDLYKWNVVNSKYLLSCLDLIEKTYSGWDTFAKELEDSIKYNLILEKGILIDEYKKSIVSLLLPKAKIMDVCGFKVPVLNSPLHQSELGNILSKDQAFALIWYQEETGRILVSLRSRENGEDVSRIARMFGGGGHERSSGFAIHPKNFPDFNKFIKNS